MKKISLICTLILIILTVTLLSVNSPIALIVGIITGINIGISYLICKKDNESKKRAKKLAEVYQRYAT